jgi:integrase/recombinase XerD
MTPRSIESYMTCVKAFSAYLDGENLATAGKDDVRDFIEHLRMTRGLSMVTVCHYLAAMSSFYEYLCFDGLATSNPVNPVRARYVRRYKDHPQSERRLISIEDMARVIGSEPSPRNRAIIATLAKTGIRRNELVTLDVNDVVLAEMTILLKPTAKRSNRLVFVDPEACQALQDWLDVRQVEGPSLFGAKRTAIYNAVTTAAARVGLHSASSARPEDHFTPHCCRHWFTTHLRRAGMRREFIQELRGDARREAIDIYDHIDREELREAYLKYIPRLWL